MAKPKNKAKKKWNKYCRVRTIISRGTKYVQVVSKGTDKTSAGKPTTKVLKSFGVESLEAYGWAYHWMASYEAINQCIENEITDKDILRNLFGLALGKKVIDELMWGL